MGIDIQLQVAVHIFDAFINRLIDFDYPSHVGLITFASAVKEQWRISDNIYRLREALHGIRDSDFTNLWDALELASKNLSAYAEKHPNARKRILVLSDGEDNSGKSAFQTCQTLQRAKIIVDSFVIGGSYNMELKAISHAYVLHPLRV